MGSPLTSVRGGNRKVYLTIDLSEEGRRGIYRPDDYRGKGEMVRILNERVDMRKKIHLFICSLHNLIFRMVRAHQSRSDSAAWQTPT